MVNALVNSDLLEHFDMGPLNGLVRLNAAGDPPWTKGKNKKLGYKTKQNTEGINGFLPNMEKDWIIFCKASCYYLSFK